MPSAALEPTIQSTDLSHMPFLFQQGGDLIMVFAWSRFRPRRVPQYSRSGTTRIWRLAWQKYDLRSGAMGLLHRLDTGLEANEVACSPCVDTVEGDITVSFIGTAHHGTGPLEHHLFRMRGPSLDQLQPAVAVSSVPCFCGFSRPDLTATGSGADGYFRLEGAVQARFSTSFTEIARLSYDPNHPWQLLITGTLPNETQARTIIYHAKHAVVLGELQVAGAPTYKPALCDGVLAQPLPVQSRFRESWRVAFTRHYSVSPTPIRVEPA